MRTPPGRSACPAARGPAPRCRGGGRVGGSSAGSRSSPERRPVCVPCRSQPAGGRARCRTAQVLDRSSSMSCRGGSLASEHKECIKIVPGPHRQYAPLGVALGGDGPPLRHNDVVGTALSRQLTVWAGLIGGAIGVVGIVALVSASEGSTNRATPALALVVPVLLVAILAGRVAALAIAVVAAVALNLAFIPPRWTLKIDSVDDAVALAVFVVVALVVGTLVAREVERRRAAEQRQAEIETLYAQYEAMAAERERLMDESHRLELLERIDDERRALLRSVSHDLRTPLAAIRAATSDMRDGIGYDDATRDELLDIVGDEAERLDRLVANLLSLSRIEAGALQPDRQAVALDELLGERVRRLKRLLRGRRILLDVPFALPLADVDHMLVDQVVTNLLENAVPHSPDDSSIRVRARARDGSIEVSVADAGPGIDPAVRPCLFEPFQRGEGGGTSGV